jgi:hypothetical protein
MNGVPPSDKRPEDIDDHYQRMSSVDTSRPSEDVRRAILTHAAQVASALAAKADRPDIKRKLRPAYRGWRPAVFGSLLAAAFAGILVTPLFLNTPPAPNDVAPRGAVSQRDSAADIAASRRTAGAPNVQVPTVAEPIPQSVAPSKPRAPTVNSPASAEQRYVSPNVSSADATSSIAVQNAPKSEGISTARDLAAKTSQGAASAMRQPPAVQTGNQNTALRRAAEAGDIAELQLLFDQHVDLESRDAEGRTALMIATLNGQTGSVEALLAHGADPNAADARGMTPLQAAAAGDYRAIAAALAQAGAH